jgi:hypothetical protein
MGWLDDLAKVGEFGKKAVNNFLENEPKDGGNAMVAFKCPCGFNFVVDLGAAIAGRQTEMSLDAFSETIEDHINGCEKAKAPT